MNLFRRMMQKAVAKIPLCRTCGLRPCGCDEIERRIVEQLRLKLEVRSQEPGVRSQNTRRHA